MNIERLNKYTTITISGCWEWNRSCSSSGYGQLTEDGKYWNTHVYSWELHNGPLKPNEIVRHKCHNRKCWNPEHLLLGSHKENYADSIQKYKISDQKRRKSWIVFGVSYATCRDAVSGSRVSMNSIIKYTKNGIFDEVAYQEGCSKGKRR